ncbi:hypothetical protein ACSBR1_020208 [Camellia fascicularis]
MLEEEVGVCIEVVNGSRPYAVKHEHITEVMNTVMDETEKGEEMRRKASEIRKKMEDAIADGGEGFKGSSIKALDEFVSMVISTTKISVPSMEVDSIVHPLND